MAVKDVVMADKDKSILSLKRNVDELKGKLHAETNKRNMRAKRATSTLDDNKKKECIEEGHQIMWSSMLKLLTSGGGGGISRLPIFNDIWHKANPTAAKLFMDIEIGRKQRHMLGGLLSRRGRWG